MSCCHQRHDNRNHSHYNIQNIKPRFIPTYYHEQVFINQNGQNAAVRCTPTFHSTAMNVNGYQPTTNQHLKHHQAQPKDEQTTTYMNNTISLRHRDLSPGHHCCGGKTKVEWYDHAKLDLFAHMRYATARDRKIADLSSNPVFGGNFFMSSCRESNQCRGDTHIQAVHQGQTKVVDENHHKQQVEVDDSLDQINEEQKENLNQKKNPQPQPQTSNTAHLSPNIQHLIQKQVQQQLKNHTLSLHKDTKPSSNQPQTNKLLKQSKSLAKTSYTNVLPKKQQFNATNDVNFGQKNVPAGRKLNKVIVVGSQKPTFTVVRNR